MQTKFYAALFVTLVTLSTVTLWSTYRADPYALFGKSITEPDREKRDLFFNLRLHKPYAMRDQAPQALILGSSTVGPLQPGRVFAKDDRAYNAALPGATLYEIRRTLEHAQAYAPVRKAVIGLEFYQFRTGKRASMPGFADNRLMHGHTSGLADVRHRWQTVLDYWSALFSRSALEEIRQQKLNPSRSNRQFYPDGSWQNIPGSLGRRWLFNLIAAQKYAEFSELENRLDFTQLGQLIDSANAGGTQVQFIISPLHAYTLSAIRMADGLDIYMDWVRRTVAYLQDRDIQVLSLAPSATAQAHAVNDASGLFTDGIHISPGGAKSLGACLKRQQQGSACTGFISYSALTRANIASHLKSLADLIWYYPTQQHDDYRKLGKLINRQRELQDRGVDIVKRYL